jgi:hypothetical protein
MKIEVYNCYSEKTETFSGEPEQVRNQLNERYDFLKRYEHGSLQQDLEKLSQQQSLFLEVTEK